jgi:uncharacterized protein
MYIALGGVAGILAGLLGVGGGIVIVPALTFIFTAQRLSPEYTVHLAVGTSLATILFTSVASSRAHHGRGAVDWPIVRSISPGIVVGTLAGSWVAAQMTTRFLKGFFVAFIAYVALQMLLDIRPKPSRSLPGGMTVTGVGGIIGGISSLVGIGGGSMSVPFLVWCNVAMHRAIGTSAAIGFPIAAAGAAGYVANGFAMPLPPLCVGFVYLPALVGVACASFITAPLGARMAHRLPVGGLKKIFAVLLLATGAKLLAGFF